MRGGGAQGPPLREGEEGQVVHQERSNLQGIHHGTLIRMELRFVTAFDLIKCFKQLK